MDWINTIVESAGGGAAVAALFTALAAAAAALASWAEVGRAKTNSQVQVFIELARHWNDVFPIVNEVAAMPLDTDAIIAEYGDGRHQLFLVSEEWKKIRHAAGFYEFLGALIDRKFIDKDMALELVMIDRGLWERIKPLVVWLRGVQEPLLYENYEKLVARLGSLSQCD